MSFKSWFWALEDTGGSWLGFVILLLIWIWSLVFGTAIIRILALYLDFEGSKNNYVIPPMICDFTECWRPLNGVWHLDLDLYIVTCLWYTHVPLVHTYSKFWLSILSLKVQRTSMSFKSSFGTLEDAGGPWMGFGIFSWSGYGLWSLIHSYFEFCPFILILK